MSFKNLLYLWKYNKLKSGSKEYFDQLVANEDLTYDELQQVQWQKTKKLVKHAYDHSAFYRERFDEIGIENGLVQSEEQFRSIPILTREDLISRSDQIMCKGVDKRTMNSITTGGSTGEPVTVYHPKNVNRAAALWRMKGWWGLSAVASVGTVYRGSSDWKTRLKNKLVNWPSRLIHLDAANMTEKKLKAFIFEWNRSKPTLLHGYVGGLMELLEYAEAKEIELHSPRAIWTTSAPLTEVQRVRLESFFKSEVYDQYGCCEVFYLAAEGPEKYGLRFFSDIRRVEFVDEHDECVADEVEGDVIITDLENFDFPIIRYRNGDRSRFLQRREDLNHPFEVISAIKGRISERIVTPTGIVITGEYLTTIFDDFAHAIRAFKVHQDISYNLTIYVVPKLSGKEFDKVLTIVKERLLKNADYSIEIFYQIVGHIEHEAGKLRFISSDITR